ncbi:MAG: 5'-3' exonuclease [Armatimonadota bacterium]|nr:5'-3' exonuclease [Armatimonadota bacterium]MDR7452440.1 5'-3' exonuclease [Armatimonadota bacterium]MDR7466178.1 5'-3' exonuclease [Armatimonadota bacterium]MDR7495139.1 5'-3' exonuclease [Armatimonadota bacterium]MDR7505791.1 5'-3' exonuclease [Armatimonadota bacterium]
MPASRLLLLVDGDALLYRAAHAIPRMTGPRGLPTNGLYGFAGMIWQLRTTLTPSHMAVAFTADPPLVKHGWDPTYKINHYEHPEEIKRQIPYALRFVEAAGARAFLESGYEADDVLATLVGRRGRLPVRIVTSDRDFYQLVSTDVLVLRPVRGVSEMQTVDTAAVWAAFGVAPAQVPDLRALVGDPSDDIIGVRGIGPKTAASLLHRHGTVEALLDHLDDGGLRTRLGPLRDRILLNKRLSIPLTVPLARRPDLTVREPQIQVLRALAEETDVATFTPR